MSEGSITDSIKNWKALQAYSRVRHHEYQSEELLYTLEKIKKNSNEEGKPMPSLDGTLHPPPFESMAMISALSCLHFVLRP